MAGIRVLRAARLGSVLLIFLGLEVRPALADEYYPPVTDPLVLQECGACHMAYPPSFLPKASWERIVAGLSDHFGEDASLSAKSAKAVLAYLVAHSSESQWRGGWSAQSPGADQAPLRITDTPFWIERHAGERPLGARNGGRANCPACHFNAVRGRFARR